MAKNGPYRELTFLSVIAAVITGVILNMGISFAGMQIGFTIVGSTVAAVIGFGFLRGVLRRGSILEVNIFQTVASGVNTVNAGIIFTIPVLFLLGMDKEMDLRALMLAATAGSLLGVVIIVPLRKQIIDLERLRFPEGVATAAILKSPGAGVAKARLLLISIAFSATVLTLTKLPVEDPLLSEHFNIGKLIGLPAGLRLVLALSLLSLGAGYLAGRHGLVILYGTLLNFWVLIPFCLWMGWVPAGFEGDTLSSLGYERADSFNGAFAGFTSKLVGVGMILGGAIAGILVALPALKSAFGSLKSSPAGGAREEVSMRVLTVGAGIGFVMLLVATWLSGGGNVSWGTALIAAVAGTLWLWIAGLVVAQTTGRTDWSPLSGLALIAIAIMMGIMGTADEYIIPAVTVGAAICVATSMCADMMADLKTGYLIGGKPIKQQIAQIATCWIGPPVAVGTVFILWSAYSFGPDQAQRMYDRQVEQGTVQEYVEKGGGPDQLARGIPNIPAPQAGVLESAINIVQSGDIPLGKYLTGAVLGLLVSLLVSPGLGVMIGLSIYLPFDYMAVFGIGGILSILVTRWKGARFAEDKGVPIAAGLIVGDALVNVGDAIVRVIKAGIAS